MGSSQIAVNKEGQALKRAGFVYDVVQRGLDASFWKELATTVSVVSSKLRLASGGSLASYTQFKYGIFQFAVNIASTPSAGEAKKFGLLLPGTPAVGSAYFEIKGAVFNAVSYDDDGNAQTTDITASFPGAAAEKDYEIEWEEDYVIFKIEGVVVASHQTRVGKTPLPIYLLNSDADNADFGSIIIKETATYV